MTNRSNSRRCRLWGRSATGGHGDVQGMFPCRCNLGLSKVADSPAKIRELVRMEHAFGSNWIKTMNTGGCMSFGDDPARVTWFDDEMQCLAETARQLGMPLAVHTGAPEGCKQALRAGARSLVSLRRDLRLLPTTLARMHAREECRNPRDRGPAHDRQAPHVTN